MEINMSSQNHYLYSITNNTILLDFLKHEDIIQNKINKIEDRIKYINDFSTLCLLDKLIISYYVSDSNQLIKSNIRQYISNDLYFLNKEIILNLYSYYTFKNCVGLFLMLLNNFIQNYQSLIDNLNTKSNIYLLMDIFQPTKVIKQNINYNGSIICAVTLNTKKSK